MYFYIFFILIVDEETIKLLRNNQYMLRESLRLFCFQNGGGWWQVFSKNQKVPGYFLRWVGRSPPWKFNFFRKYPLKEDKVFSESTRPPWNNNKYTIGMI